MHQVRLWEITADRKLSEIPARFTSLEQWIEDWLADDIAVLDPNLVVIGWQVRTSFGGAIDLLCMDGDGNLVVVELKRGQTSRDVTSQSLEYSSWVKDLEYDEITGIADSYRGIAGTLEAAFREKYGSELPDELNQTHRSVIVAESVDASTDRIVRYLAEMGVPINVTTAQHFEDANGRELLAQVYLIEPESVQPRARRTSASSWRVAFQPAVDVLHDEEVVEVGRIQRLPSTSSDMAMSALDGFLRQREDKGILSRPPSRDCRDRCPQWTPDPRYAPRQPVAP